MSSRAGGALHPVPISGIRGTEVQGYIARAARLYAFSILQLVVNAGSSLNIQIRDKHQQLLIVDISRRLVTPYRVISAVGSLDGLQ